MNLCQESGTKNLASFRKWSFYAVCDQIRYVESCCCRIAFKMKRFNLCQMIITVKTLGCLHGGRKILALGTS